MFTNDLPLLLLCVYGCCNRLSVRYIILCNNIYCELHVVGLLVYVIMRCYFVCWLVLFGRANNNHRLPPLLLLSTPTLLVCILAFLTGIRMAMISEPSQRLHSLPYILLHSFPDQFFGTLFHI